MFKEASSAAMMALALIVITIIGGIALHAYSLAGRLRRPELSQERSRPHPGD